MGAKCLHRWGIDLRRRKHWTGALKMGLCKPALPQDPPLAAGLRRVRVAARAES